MTTFTRSHPGSDPWLTAPGAIRRGLQCAAALLLAAAGVTWAQTPNSPFTDPPGSVARLGVIEGDVSFAPAEWDGAQGNGVQTSSAWTPAQRNRPLTSGDRLWAGPGARTEVHVGANTLRMNAQTSLDFVTLDDSATQLRVAQGTLRLHVRALPDGQRLEVDTPNLGLVISQPGDYRIDVTPGADTTRVVAQAGSAMVYGDSGEQLPLGNQQQASFSGTHLTPAAPGASQQDAFDAWATARDRREDQSPTARYVSRETVGYQQLDNYGDWQQDPGYGAVWLPRAVPVDWAPYRVGHWSWIAPWGWTWIDDAPWGFAPFHYGRWAQIGPRWAWVPPRLGPRPVYAPALVAFLGSSNDQSSGLNWRIAIGPGGQTQPTLGWFPLAPGEAFRPAYRASPRYVTRVNNITTTVTNTANVSNNTNITNITNVAPVYRYQHQATAVTATSAADFARGQGVRGHLHTVSASDLGRAQVINAAPPSAPEPLHPLSPLNPPNPPNPLNQRPPGREALKPAPGAAVPPAALLRPPPVVASRVDRIDRQEQPGDAARGQPRDERVQGRPDNRTAQAAPAPIPAATTPAAANTAPAANPAAGAAQADGQAQQKMLRDQQLQQQRLQKQQSEAAQAQATARQNAEQNAQRNAEMNAQRAQNAAQIATQNAARQNEQKMHQQQAQQALQAERAQREQGKLQRQQDQQRPAKEQAQRAQQAPPAQPSPQSALQRQPQAPRVPQEAQKQGAEHPRAPRPEGVPPRNREP